MQAKQQTEQRDGVLPPVNSEALNKIAVDKLFGKRHWAAEWALELCAADPYFAAHMAEQPPGYAHYLCVLQLAWVDASDLKPDMAKYARTIRMNSKKRLLKAWFPTCPVEILKAFPALPRKVQSEAEYWRLIEAFKDERKRKHFFHVKRVRKFDMQLLDMMEDLPERFRPGAAHCRNNRDHERLCLLIECAKRLNLDISACEFRAVAKRAKNMAGLWRYVAGMMLKLPFPPPPWEGDDKIRPLRTRREMKDAGRELGNCVANHSADYAIKTVTGHGYLYFCEDMPAMIEIIRDALFGWVVGEIKGPHNDSVSWADELYIKRAFQSAGICSATMMCLEATRDELWGGILDDSRDDDDDDESALARWERDETRSEREVEEFFGGPMGDDEDDI